LVLVGVMLVVLPPSSEAMVLVLPPLLEAVVLPVIVLPEAVFLVLPTPVVVVVAELPLAALPVPDVVGEIVGEIVELAFALTPEPVAWPPVRPVPPTVPWLETLAPFVPWAVLPVELLLFDDEFAANAL
jgi:hypothetical protein